MFRDRHFSPVLYACGLSVILVFPILTLKAIEFWLPTLLPRNSGAIPFLVFVALYWLWVAVFPVMVLAWVTIQLVRKRRRNLQILGTAATARSVVRSMGVLTFTMLLTGSAAYLYWPIYTLDDGPFYCKPFDGDESNLDVTSKIRLRRFGREPFLLEARVGPQPEYLTVLVLRDSSGRVIWKTLAMYGDSPLKGRLEFNETYSHLSWWGGWTVVIKPESTEGGELYLSPWGGFRYFYLSW
jgi:hypothetical protein